MVPYIINEILGFAYVDWLYDSFGEGAGIPHSIYIDVVGHSARLAHVAVGLRPLKAIVLGIGQILGRRAGVESKGDAQLSALLYDLIELLARETMETLSPSLSLQGEKDDGIEILETWISCNAVNDFKRPCKRLL